MGPPWRTYHPDGWIFPFLLAGLLIIIVLGAIVRRGSLRSRLTVSFMKVALVTMIATFATARWAAFYGGPGPWSFRAVFVGIAVSVGSAYFIAKRITRQLSRLRDAVERIDLKDLSVRVPVEGEDEVGTLARAFNRMVERLENAERSRRQLFADVAHELRHPLAVLRGRLEMIQDGVVSLDEKQVMHLQDMAIGLSRLVDDLRDLSLADVDRLTLDLKTANLGALVSDVQENMQPVAAAKDITLEAEIASGLPQVLIDANRIRQVLVNLLANALHYTPDGGRVHVRVGHGKEPERVIIEVEDSGPGISPADLPHIFDRFYRTDKARARATGGSGLGLAIVRSLVELHGGRIDVASRPGKGTRFTITLPVEGPKRGGASPSLQPGEAQP